MKGDFSIWYHDPHDNDQGVLYQQGRVMRDADMTASELISLDWRNQAGRDVIGAAVAAAPAHDPDGFKVESANADAAEVRVQLRPGRLWADGLLLHLPPDPADPMVLRERVAKYLESPPNPAGADVGSIANGVRDAVVLEVALEELNAFQDPARLLEPALGGPDTAARINARYGLRLLRLGPGEDCENIVDKLADGPSGKGRLSVSLTPPEIVAIDCPAVTGGGYTGFEHNLYRVEIAEMNAGPAHFKWSAFNGALVGRGRFHASAPKRVVITANRPAIVHAGLTKFYLEALQRDDDLGHWRVVYGAVANLNSDFDLELTDPPVYGAFPATTDPVFFRLWNGLEPVSSFIDAADPQPLRDGIHLVFDPPGAGAGYRPGDYWVFSVRAGEIENPETLIDAQPPLGPLLRRVPLAILNWSGAPPVTVTAAAGEIHDCRHVFQPLTRLRGCCTYTVGDGIVSFGEFDTIQAAVDALPTDGGEVCVLPGLYVENVVINGKDNVVIKGCGTRSRVNAAVVGQAVIDIVDADHTRVESLVLVAHLTGPGVLVQGTPISSDITLRGLHINAATRSAIEVQAGQLVTIEDCHVLMNDVASPWPGMFVTADDVLIGDNVIRVQPTSVTGMASGGAEASAGRGGLQIGGTSERVRVIDNLIEAGIGNGITLGTLEEVNTAGTVVGVATGWVVNGDDVCDPCMPGDVYLPPPGGGPGEPTYQSAGALYDILIERNRIFEMGLNGIGVVAFFNLDAQDEFITVEGLRIVANEIRGCLKRSLANIDAGMIDAMGYGGIALADVENLNVRHNLIEDNGPDHLEPVCGVFVLHGEGVDISDNRIVNNGAKTDQPSHTAKDGRRGGINIVLAIAPTVPTPIGAKLYPAQNGVPAAKIHDNVVSHPLGQALSLTALGPVSVANNHFTSRGMILKTNPISPSFLATTVMIMNLGLSNEFYLQIGSFSGVLAGSTSVAAGPSVSGDAVLVPREDLDDKRVSQYLANGNVLFSDNRCDLDLLETGLGFALSSIAIFSLDDVGFHNNQCDCNLLDDIVITQAILFGLSMRASDNRLKEGLVNALYSAMTIGLMNATTNNQSTHCLLVIGALASLKVETGNRALINGLIPNFCESLKLATGNASFGLLGGLI